jgi:MFS family permease
LVGIPKAELLADVERFATEHGLEEELPTLRKGALVAQNPQGYDTIAELDDEDRAFLHEEATKRWAHGKTLYFTIILNSIAAAIQGWDQTGSNGANLSFPAALGIDSSSAGCVDGTISSSQCQSWEWIQGFINACPYIVIAVFAGWLSDPMNHYFGRRITIFVGAIFSLLSPFGMATSQTWAQLAVCRGLLGVGMGLKEVTVPVYSAEVAPSNVRGGLVMSW